MSFHADPITFSETCCFPLVNGQGRLYSRPWTKRSNPANPALLGLVWEEHPEPQHFGRFARKVLRPGFPANDPLTEYWGRTVAPVVIQDGQRAGRLVLAVTDVINRISVSEPEPGTCWNNDCKPFVVYSDNGGIDWSDRAMLGPQQGVVILDPPNESPGWPSIAVHPINHHWVYVAYAAADETSGKFDIIIARSIDAGVTFDDTVRLTDAMLFPGQSERHQWFPAIAVDSCGGVNLLFYTIESNGDSRPWYARLDDSLLLPLTVEPLADAYPNAILADYLQITAVGNLVYPAYVAREPLPNNQWTNQRLFVRRIETCPPAVRIQVVQHNTCGGGIEIDQTLQPGQNASFNLSSCAQRVIITTTTPLADLGHFTFTGGPSAWPLDISLGSAFNANAAARVPVARHWAGLDASAIATSRFYGAISGDLTGALSVGELFRLEARGQIQAAITAASAGNGDTCIIRAGEIPSSASITIANGTLQQIETISGDLAGALTVGGAIREVIVSGDLRTSIASVGTIERISIAGDIGAPGTPVTIATTSPSPTEQADINSITAEAIYANITTPNTTPTEYRGDVGRVVTTAGPFVGSLTTYALGTNVAEPALEIAGDLDADIDVATIQRPIHIAGVFSANRTIRIGKDLAAAATFRIFSSLGLEGQVAIRANDGLGDGWLGDVLIGPGPNPITLSPRPAYEQLLSQVGGGAVGEVPYMLYGNECIPLPNTSLVFAPTMSVSLYHYGPVEWTGTEAPVIVDWRPSGTANWYTLPDEDFWYWQGADPRELIITALLPEDFGPGHDYRIRPRPGVLKCAGSGMDVDPYEYLLHGD
jgi:hypothetical protein